MIEVNKNTLASALPALGKLIYRTSPMTLFKSSKNMSSSRIELIRKWEAYLNSPETEEESLKRYQLFLFTNGYFAHDRSEILPILTRLWLIHSNIPIQIQSWSIVDPGNMNTVANDLASLDWQPRPQNAGWHQRMFGTSQI